MDVVHVSLDLVQEGSKGVSKCRRNALHEGGVDEFIDCLRSTNFSSRKTTDRETNDLQLIVDDHRLRSRI